MQTRVSGALLALVLVSCAKGNMRPPAGADSTRKWLVDGLHANWLSRPSEFHIGQFRVTRVHELRRKSLPASTSRMRYKEPSSYAYNLSGDGRELAGECHERVTESAYFGIGKIYLAVTCTCSEGGAVKAELTADQQGGSLSLAGVQEPLSLSAERLSTDGQKEKDPLGYVVSDAQGAGGVDLSSSAVSWFPASLPRVKHAEVACAYAGLLLHRPVLK